MRIHITEKIARDYCVPANRSSVVITDLELPGFGVQKTRTGHLSYIVRYRDAHGRQRQQTFARMDELPVAAARAQARELLAKQKQLKRTQTAPSLLSPLMDEFFYSVYYPRVRLAARSHKTHAGLYRTHVQPQFGQHRMNAITEQQVLDFAHLLQNKPAGYANFRVPTNRLLAPSTVSRILVLFRHMFNMAKTIPSTHVKNNPVDSITIRSQRRFVGRFLNADELRRLLHAAEQSANPLFADIFRVLAGTGLRRNNVLRMQWGWYDAQRGTLLVPMDEDKGKKNQMVALSQPICALLDKRRKQVGRHSKWVFANPRTGKPFHSCRYAWVRTRELAGLPTVRMHDLRHTYASMMLEAGANLVDVQHALGHSSVSTTQIYTHISERRRKEQAEKTAAVLSIFD